MKFIPVFNSEPGFMNFSALLILRCPHRPRPAVLGVALAVLSVSALASNPIAAPDRKRVEAAVATARASAGTDLVARSSMTNARGRTIVHATQMYQGHRVWGSEAVVHADRAGTTRIAASNLATDPVPAGTPTLSQAQAIAIARKAIGLKGRSAPPKSELVVFPTKYHGDVKLAWDAARMRYTFDRANSVMTVRPTDPYVWAWEVQVFANNRVDGVRDMKYVIDARTGAVIHVATGNQSLAPMNPPVQLDTDVAAVGTGYSQWSGIVPLSTTQHADGTYAMIDRTRGSKYNPYLHDDFYDDNGNQILAPDGNPISVIGLQSMTETHEGFGATWTASNWWFDGNADNTWGDGTQFVMYPYGGETTANGQTAAVDAHWGMATTWDYYMNVFGRNGIDNQGTSPISVVHVVDSNEFYYDNAYWDDYVFGMFYSDGTLNPGVDPNTGLPTTPNPEGFNTLTEIDIIGHEMTHGVTAATDALEYDGESGGLNESSSDIMGSMVEAYSTRLPGNDSVIPATGTDWLMGAKIAASPLRSMIKPSVDNVSSDIWYSGIQYLDVHFSSGPMNRCFYFLSQGASSDKTAQAYSPYLPGGMTGIGNDHAARIWYTAMTEWLTPMSKYKEARAAAVNAAIELYGDGSAEVIAVKSAFAAINVGTPTDAPRVTIEFPIAQVPGTALNPYGGDMFERMPVVAMNTTVKLGANVTNATDTSVTWKLGGMPGAFNNPGFRVVGGTVTDDGTWSPDNVWGFHSMTVVSNADPMEYAEGAIWVVDGDADADTEFDAIDLGGVALSWGLDGWVNASHSIVMDGWVDSMDVTAIDQAFKNAYGGI
jgi:Zn-dependent metalloprotease